MSVDIRDLEKEVKLYSDYCLPW